MPSVPPIPLELWNQIPPTVQEAILALVERYEQRLQELHQQVAELQQRLSQNSTNSSKPPSSDPPTLKRAPPKPPSRNKAGGQHGHAESGEPIKFCRVRREGLLCPWRKRRPILHRVANLDAGPRGPVDGLRVAGRCEVLA